MALILHIDTSLETAYVSLSDEGKQIGIAFNNTQNDHASWIHIAIRKLMEESGFELKNLQAVAIIAGPGSYTGLRVGMSTAKGLCYALNIPLITIGTLYAMAAAAKRLAAQRTLLKQTLLCPLIDARRMEVFTAVYDMKLNEVLAPTALIMQVGSFENLLSKQLVLFFGNGSMKWQKICDHPNAHFESIGFDAETYIEVTYSKFLSNEFTVLAYAEPVYIKEFYTHPKK